MTLRKIGRFVITVITLDCTEVQHTTTAISSTRYPNISPLSFIISVGTMLTSSYDNSERSSRAKDIGVIAENKEKYISFNVKVDVHLEMDGKPVTKKIELRFIDSFRFMASSLDSLARNLTDDQCKNLRWFYQEEEVFKLMRRKGVYPYEYMDRWERFKETRLPPKEAFYSKLYMEDISDKDYEHAQQVWNIMDEKTLGSTMMCT